MKNSIKLWGLISNDISLGKKKVKIKLLLKNKTERLVLILINVFYLLNSLFNFISLGFLNNIRIYYHINNQILYNFKTWKVYICVKQYNPSFLLYPFNLLSIVINSLKNSEIYKKEGSNIN